MHENICTEQPIDFAAVQRYNYTLVRAGCFSFATDYTFLSRYPLLVTLINILRLGLSEKALSIYKEESATRSI